MRQKSTFGKIVLYKAVEEVCVDKVMSMGAYRI